MINKEAILTRREIESRLATVGDYVKMDYLQACLKKQVDFDTKKFMLLKLAEVYESRKMFLEAGRMMRNAAEINATFDGKMNDFMKSTELFIKGGGFDDADISFTKVLGCSTELQKHRLKQQRKEFYLRQAREYVARDKRKHAMETFERYLTLDVTPAERQEAQRMLLDLYQKLGKIKEYYSLQRSSSSNVGQQRSPRQPTRESASSNDFFD